MPQTPVYNFNDLAEGFLSASVNDADLSLSLESGGGVSFPASYFVVWCQAEAMIAASRSNDVITITARGAGGTSAVAHSIKETIRQRYGKLYRDSIVANILDIPVFATTTPGDTTASGLAGTGLSAAANDHVHKGIASVTVSGNPNSYGVISLIQGTGASLSQSGGSITIGAPAGGGSFTLNFNNNPILSGQATLIQGTGASLSQSGASITVATTGTSHTLNFNNNPTLAGQTTLVQGTAASLSQSGASITIGVVIPQGLVVDASTPINIAAAGAVGTSASAAHGDHTHGGVLSVSVPTMAAMLGGIALVQGTGASLSQSGASITIGATGGGSHTLNFNNNPILAGQTTLIQGTGASLSQSGASITIGATGGGSFTLNNNNAPILNGQATLVQGTGTSISQSGASITVAQGDGGVNAFTFWRSDVVATGIAAQGLNLAAALTELEATQRGTRQLVGTGDIGEQVALHVNCCVVVAVAATIGVSILDVSNTANSLVGVTFTGSTTGPRIAKSAYTNRASWLTGDKTLAVYTASGNGAADFIFKDISLRHKA